MVCAASREDGSFFVAAMKFNVGGELVTADELVALGATDPDLFYQLFFPKTVRQDSAAFHLTMDSIMENPSDRFVHLRMFRGSAKTTRLRMYTLRRIAYGLSHTILYVGASEGHAARSLKWVRKQVEVNKVLKGAFHLVPGSKWQETELEIVSKITDETCWLLGAGITGNIRGINFDDYRPDLIILDDVITDENAATHDQREKVVDLILGALRGSLVPPSEDPNAKMVFAQTPMHNDDASSRAARNSSWTTLEVPIWSPVDAPIEERVASWEERYPKEWCEKERNSYIEENKLSVWSREMEMKLVTPENRAFKSNWLQPIDIMPKHTLNILSIDPVPPPSDREVAAGLKKKDYEVHMVIGHNNGNYYVREYKANRGHEPNWTVATFFELAIKYNVFLVVVEGIAYQRTLKWILEQEMRRRGIYFPVEAVTDVRKKYMKIVPPLARLGSGGKLFCASTHGDLISQFLDYPMVDHDDHLDALAQGLMRLASPVLEMGADQYIKSQMHGKTYKVPRPKGAP